MAITFHQDNRIKIGYNPTNIYAINPINHVGPTSTGRTLDITPSNDNSIFVSSLGSDTSTGTLENPVLTINHAITLCDATHNYIIITDSEKYDVYAFIVPPNLAGIYAAVGVTPTIHFIHDLTSSTGNTHLDDGLYYLKTTMEERIGETVDTTYAACVLPNGNTVMAYRRSAGTTDRLYIKIVTKDGDEILDETQILNYSYSSSDTNHTSGRIFVAAYDDGKFVVAYQSNAYTGTTLARGIYLRCYYADGTTYNSEWRTFTTAIQSTAGLGAMITLPNGNIVLAGRLTRAFPPAPSDEVYFGFYIIDSDTLETVAKYDFDDGAYEPYCHGAALQRNLTGGFSCAVLIEDQDTEYGYESVQVATFSEDGVLQGSVGTVLAAGHTVNLYSSKIDIAVNSEGRVMVVFNDVYSTTCYLNASVWTNQGAAVLNSILIESKAGTQYRENTQAALKANGKYFYVGYVIGGTHKVQYYNTNGSKVLDVSEQITADEIDSIISYVELDGDIVTLAQKTTGAVCLTRIFNANIKSILSDRDITFDCITFDAENDVNVGTFIKLTDSKLRIKNVRIKHHSMPGGSSSLPFKLVDTNGEVETIDSAWHDATSGFDIANNNVNITNCQYYRITLDYGIKIDGAGENIIINHCDSLKNYGGVKLINNDGSEIIKNSNFHIHSDYGISAETTITINNCVYASLDNVTAGTGCINANPLYVNEGASNPDLIDLNIKTKRSGYKITSPAYLLADDGYNSGSYLVSYSILPESRTYVTLPKPQISRGYEAVGNVTVRKKSGNESTYKDGYTVVYTLTWNSLTVEDFEALLDVIKNKSNSLHWYPDSVSNQYAYIACVLRYTNINASPSTYTQFDLGNKDIIIQLSHSLE